MRLFAALPAFQHTASEPFLADAHCDPPAGALTAVGELSTEQRTVLKEHGLAWVLFLTPEAQV